MGQKKDEDLDQSAPQAKRTGRESDQPREQPGEFVDEMHTNRFTDAEVPESGD